MTNEELHHIVNELSIRYFGKPFKDDVIFNHRLRTTGGRYLPGHRRIEINPKYLEELGIDEVMGIIKHELCHYHLHIQGKGYQHRDPEFKALLEQTNSPRFCNPLPSMNQKRKHVYECMQCGKVYKRIRRMNLSKYRCGRCRGMLKKHL